ncbi:hypothetical protein L1887_58263 [Cichorium endivia]|nr:hypothetical protein L1887_58263 [Cichorium endivia]
MPTASTGPMRAVSPSTEAPRPAAAGATRRSAPAPPRTTRARTRHPRPRADATTPSVTRPAARLPTALALAGGAKDTFLNYFFGGCVRAARGRCGALRRGWAVTMRLPLRARLAEYSSVREHKPNAMSGRTGLEGNSAAYDMKSLDKHLEATPISSDECGVERRAQLGLGTARDWFTDTNEHDSLLLLNEVGVSISHGVLGSGWFPLRRVVCVGKLLEVGDELWRRDEHSVERWCAAFGQRPTSFVCAETGASGHDTGPRSLVANLLGSGSLGSSSSFHTIPSMYRTDGLKSNTTSDALGISAAGALGGSVAWSRKRKRLSVPRPSLIAWSVARTTSAPWKSCTRCS